jgi:hypothetical protein
MWALHVLIAGILFLLVIGVAVVINVVVTACEAHHLAPDGVLITSRLLEQFVWGADMVCFSWLIVVEVVKFCVRLWQARLD